ncbi:hypothetical protein CWB96_04945 [Pseudoalteromonas citrea]|uniref:Sugar ABC transporter substrate-binding protein n=1 Tax=Pseudoalteromonas citrea TaxID=43655 RepID=A0A5S3XSH9_9GAMM|nr:extracellular solute-binding protein [Pseudoalteromonas citrea]TMP44724.1 hypothetical protein CWB97_05810 [Pseudoalteromonas citrea]TMP61098.1 hypothetical protein CWB96_04945 [Pseudoalteromonas citrea]
MKYIIILILSCIAFSATSAQHIDLYTWRVQEGALWQKINQQKLIPGIHVNVKVINFDTYQQHMQLVLQNGRPALFQWAPGAAALAPLLQHTFIEPNEYQLNNINPSALTAATATDAKIYGVPFAVQLEGLLVNKKLVNKLGINQRPTSLAQLESYFSQLKRNQITPLHMASDDWYLSQVVIEVLMAGLLPAQKATQLISGESCFTDPDFIHVLDTLSHWHQSGYLNKNAMTEGYQGAGTNVALANSASVFDGGWRTSPNSLFYEIDPNFEFEFWAIPGKSNKFYAFADGTYQVNARGRYSDTAKRILKFTTTQQFAELFANELNELPAYSKHMNIKSKNLTALAELVSSQGYGVSLFSAASLNTSEPSYQTLTRDAIRLIFSGKTGKQAAQSIQKGLNSWQYVGHKHCA